ncbi:hypothetical protein YC2023_072588 [Brassica napus]
MATKPNGKFPVSSANDHEVKFFKDISPGLCETPFDPFLGGSNPSKKYIYWSGNAPHLRTGNHNSRIHSIRTC